MSKTNKNQDTEPLVTGEASEVCRINNIFAGELFKSGEITRMQAISIMINQLMNFIINLDQVELSIIEDIKYIVNDFINELDYV